MSLEKISEKEAEFASDLLSAYWSERGMPQYGKAWARQYLKEGHTKETKSDEFFVLKEGGRPLGMVSLITDVSNVSEIRDLVVSTEFRGNGYGGKVLDELLVLAESRGIRKLFAMVFPEKQGMYASRGFVKEGLLKSHFSHGEDLVIMSRFLSKG